MIKLSFTKQGKLFIYTEEEEEGSAGLNPPTTSHIRQVITLQSPSGEPVVRLVPLPFVKKDGIETNDPFISADFTFNENDIEDELINMYKESVSGLKLPEKGILLPKQLHGGK